MADPSPLPPGYCLPSGAFLDGEGVWNQAIDGPAGEARGRPALFLDRDGVVVVEVEYLGRPEDARLIPGAAALVAEANRQHVPVILVTNQAGIAYGYYGWPEFVAVQERILADLTAEGARVDGVFACPHHAKGRPPFAHPDHPARKPNPGMLLKTAGLLGVRLDGSWIVGDRASDLEAGRRAGLAGGLHVLTGHGGRPGEREAALALAGPRFTVRAADSVAAAFDLLPFLAG
jgi:D-glycero-D-manno-heptose 1,7-bisphosphate phosphatase